MLTKDLIMNKRKAKKLLKQLIKDTPCPIKFIPEICTNAELSTIAIQLVGHYFDHASNEIALNALSSIEVQIAALLHEKAHAECYEKGCKCSQDRFTNPLREYHAMVQSLKDALNIGEKKIVSILLEVLDISLLPELRGTAHYKAAKRVKKQRIYRKAKDFTCNL